MAACSSFLHCHRSGDAGYLLAAVPRAAAGDTHVGHAAPACFETHLEAAVKFFRAMLVEYFFWSELLKRLGRRGESLCCPSRNHPLPVEEMPMSRELTAALSVFILTAALGWTSVSAVCEGPRNGWHSVRNRFALLVWLLCRVQACFL